MKKITVTIFVIVLIVSTLISLSGCQGAATVTPAVVETETSAEAAEVTATSSDLYPSTPEEVIRAFVISYPVDSVYAVQFLSPNLVKDLDTDSVAKLLPESGEITGFIIESGSSSAESAQSEILTNIAFEDHSAEILFKLEIVDGRWTISGIEAKE